MAEPALPAAGLWKTLAASTAVLLAGLLLLWQATAGGNAFTTETLRRTEVEAAPRPVPALRVVDSLGRASTLPQLLDAGQPVWIVDFVYTRCQTVCSALGSVFQQLQAQIVERGLQGRIGLLSVSFDPAADTPQALRDYANRMRMDPAVWRLVTLAEPQDRRALLTAFGIMVIPAPLGEFEHNAALHVVTGTGLLVHIVDYDAAKQVLALALAESP